jgi:ParB family chromosome partitioning protein
VAIAKAIEAAIGERQGQRTDIELQDNCPEVKPGIQTRDVAAERAGFDSYKTYERARRVVERGAAELVEAMDAGEVSIAAAGRNNVQKIAQFKGSREVAAERAG